MNHAEAFKWRMKAAQQGHDGALEELAYMYDNSIGVPQDDSTILNLFMEAANQRKATDTMYMALFKAGAQGNADVVHFLELLMENWDKTDSVAPNVKDNYPNTAQP